MSRRPPSKRRRSAQEARNAILDAAQERLAAAGPEGIRLQEIAAAVGLSHPAILHHFHSREGLVDAVVARAIAGLQRDLSAALAAPARDAPVDGAALFERVFYTLANAGQARLIAWLTLSGYQPLAAPALRDGWQSIVTTTHTLRLSRHRGKTKPTLEDTRLTVLLAALALFGQAIAGPSLTATAGLGEGPRVERRFRQWLAQLLGRHLAGG
jgi:AcrR family transcriptional regulator